MCGLRSHGPKGQLAAECRPLRANFRPSSGHIQTMPGRTFLCCPRKGFVWRFAVSCLRHRFTAISDWRRHHPSTSLSCRAPEFAEGYHAPFQECQTEGRTPPATGPTAIAVPTASSPEAIFVARVFSAADQAVCSCRCLLITLRVHFGGVALHFARDSAHRSQKTCQERWPSSSFPDVVPDSSEFGDCSRSGGDRWTSCGATDALSQFTYTAPGVPPELSIAFCSRARIRASYSDASITRCWLSRVRPMVSHSCALSCPRATACSRAGSTFARSSVVRMAGSLKRLFAGLQRGSSRSSRESRAC